MDFVSDPVSSGFNWPAAAAHESGPSGPLQPLFFFLSCQFVDAIFVSRGQPFWEKNQWEIAKDQN